MAANFIKTEAFGIMLDIIPNNIDIIPKSGYNISTEI